MLHGLGGTKASFLPTVAALADEYRVHAIDLPGFGDSVKPLRAAYDPAFFARAVCGFMDACGIERAHLIGNSMGGRVAFEIGFRNPARVGRIVGLTPALAWLRGRAWTPLVKALRPELGLLQITPRPVIEEVVRRFVPGGRNGWSAVGVDEFLRAYTTAAAAPRSTPRCATSTSTSPRATRASGPACASSSTSRCSSGARRTGSSRSPSPATSARRSRGPAPRARLRARAQLEARDARRTRRSGAWRVRPSLRGGAGAVAVARRFMRPRPRGRPHRQRFRNPRPASRGPHRRPDAPGHPRGRQRDPRPHPTLRGPTRTTFRNGRFRSRARRFPPRMKSTRRTRLVPPPITRMRTRLRPESADVQPQPPEAAMPSGASGRRDGARRWRLVAQRDEAAERPHVGGSVGPEGDRRVVVVEAQPLAAEALVEVRPSAKSSAVRYQASAPFDAAGPSCTCRRSRCERELRHHGRRDARRSASPSGSRRRASRSTRSSPGVVVLPRSVAAGPE